eukprot:TRINITY_DN1688_c1_g3_i1.p1 TRINITY_DN1688_c1_g3~~TRINITY_DN1688_c1_g3_i1.p1  ORF type:complete len:1707 (+),score=319.72 TRINITY_DN1688_c1_g3_i1:57-5177(+)
MKLLRENFVWVLLCWSTGLVQAVTDPGQAAALKQLYQNTWPKIVDNCCKTNGKNCGKCSYDQSSGWMTGDPCDNNWAGITCRSCPSCVVVGIDMDYNSMRGKIPNGWLAKLPDLEKLDLDGNGITGTFPDELENVPNLNNLQLGGSHTGPLPDFWTKHPETYNVLHFHGSFSGTHPPLTTMTALQEYYLWNTEVSGTIPTFDTLTEMLRMRINENDRLTGTIPDFSRGPTGQFTKILELQISDNDGLSGTIPPFTDMTVAEYVRIDEMGSVSGTLPPLLTMTRLQRFDVSHNRLIGPVPPFAAQNQQTLTGIWVEENFLTAIPALDQNPTRLDALTTLSFHHNLVTGTLPCHQVAYRSLQYLRGYNNRLTGTLPCLDNLLVIDEYRMDYNDFTGTLPDLTSGPGIKQFTVDNNMLSGTIPVGFVNGIVQVEKLHLGANGFSGTIPDVVYMSELTDFHVHRNIGYEELTPVTITSLGSLGGDTTLAAARDGDPNTDWECLPGSGDVCNVLVDFGRPVCLENLRLQESVQTRPTNGTVQENIAPVMGCPVSATIYQGSTSFALGAIDEPMIWRQHDQNTGSRNGRHGYNWQTCSPSSWRNMGRERLTNHEAGCGPNSGPHGEGGGWDPYCRDKTQYYRLNIDRCSTVPCKVAEIKFFAATSRLSGTIPKLPPDMDSFWGYGNQLTGTIPILGSRWERELRVSDNWLDGPLEPFCPSLGSLDLLWIDHNKITGTLPGNHNCLGQVTSMRVGHNQLTGTIPECACGLLEEYFLDGNACCQKPPLEPGHDSWRDEALTKIETIGAYTTCPRFGCPSGREDTGLEGPLPDFVKMPRLQRFGADNNKLRGPLNDSLAVLSDLKFFRVRHNRIAGTLPYSAIIEAGNKSSNCNEMSWYFTNNTLWGPVPDLPQPMGTCTGYNGCTRYRDGRKIYDFFIDYNHLWGPLPTRFERVRDDVVVNHNCWDCPTKPQAVYGLPMSPEPPASGNQKDLLRPPDCAEGPNTAQRYELDGPSCPAEPKNSLYEHVDKCRPEVNITATFTEEEIRQGGMSFTISFADDSFLPFFAPGLWRCLLCEDAQGEKEDCSLANCPYGPINTATGGAACPVNITTATCPGDVPLLTWPSGDITCPVGANASCPNSCQASLSCTVPVPACPVMGECLLPMACELNNKCPFGAQGEYYNGSTGACEIISAIQHAPNGTCQIVENGECPPGECNFPWSCDPSVTGTPWGPLPVNFSTALKQLLFDGMTTTAVQQYQTLYRAFYEHKDLLLPLSGFSLGPSPGSDPYVDLPTELIVKLGKAPLYDTSVTEPIGVTIWDELLVAPFGTLNNPGGYWYITPSPGIMTGTDVRVLEDVVRGYDYRHKPVTETLRVKVSFPKNNENGGWETFRCGANYSENCPAFTTVVPPPMAPRTCDFECAAEGYSYKPSITPVVCSDYEMEFEITLPDYAITDYAQEIVEMEITGNCTASGLPPLNNTLRIIINSTFEPPPTPTVTITPPITDTETITNTVSKTATDTETLSSTLTVLPFCYVHPESALCGENAVFAWLPWLLMLGVCLLGACCFLLMYALCPKPDPIEVSVSKPECTVQKPVTVGVKSVPAPPTEITVGVKKVIEDSIDVNVNSVAAEDVTVSVSAVPHASSDVTIGVRKVGVPASGDIMVNVSKDRNSASVEGDSLFSGSSSVSLPGDQNMAHPLLHPAEKGSSNGGNVFLL